MKLLIITQKVDSDDDVLGFMHAWISEFVKACELVTVICLQQGKYHFPENVKVLSLGKETGKSRLKYLFNFYRYIRQERKNYEAVFVHMNEIYVILGWLCWKLWRKKISLWYAHGHVSFSLKIAAKLADIIFTSTKSGFRLPSKKVQVIGQGIDTNKFRIKNYELGITNDKFKIISVGRISPSKDYATLINAIAILTKEYVGMEVNIIGGPATAADQNYLKEMRQLVKDKNLGQIIKFIGSVANKDLVSYLQTADLFVNMGRTGSLDKAMLEAAACGLPILTCNEAMLEVLGPYTDKLMYETGNSRQLTDKIKSCIMWGEKERRNLGYELRKIVVQKHSLPEFIKKILSILNNNVYAEKEK